MPKGLGVGMGMGVGLTILTQVAWIASMGLVVTVPNAAVKALLTEVATHTIKSEVPLVTSAAAPVIQHQVQQLVQALRIEVDGMSIRLPSATVHRLTVRLARQAETQLQRSLASPQPSRQWSASVAAAAQALAGQRFRVHLGPVPVTIQIGR